MIDLDVFLRSITPSPLPRPATAEQKQGFLAIIKEWEDRGLPDLRMLAYMLATTWHETAHTMQPIREIGHGRGRVYGRVDPVTRHAYYGRGYVQLTWKYNYESMGKITGVDLVRNPDLAMRPEIATKILFEGMIRGSFTSKALSHYFKPNQKPDWVNARKIINGTDRAAMIAGIAMKFYDDLVAASGDAPMIGDEQHDVFWIQTALNRLGHKPELKVDGESGKLTREAVRKFQELNGLKPDGSAGPKTVDKMEELLAALK